MPKKTGESSRSLGKKKDKGDSVVKSEKKKKKKSKDSVAKPESSMTLLSTESKAKKKKAKSSTSLTGNGSKEKKKLKKGKKKLLSGTIQENGEHVKPEKEPAVTTVPQSVEPVATTTTATSVEPQTASNDGGDSSLNEDTNNNKIDSVAMAASLEDDINDDINDDMDMMENSQIFDSGPPIGEILASATEEDNVSDIGEAITDGDPMVEVIDGVEIIYNPDDTDICFDDRHHPGTKDWILVVRECLKKFEGQEYSPPVYKTIKKKLKGRRFLVRTRRNERTSWREATKPEVIELFGECFNEERRRIAEGITDDDSAVDSSLQSSLAQSGKSASVADIIEEDPPPQVNGTKAAPTPMSSAPTPRASNQQEAQGDMSIKEDKEDDRKGFELHNPPQRTKSDTVLASNRKTARLIRNQDGRQSVSASESKTDRHLLMAMREIESAEDYAKPFDDVNLLKEGIAAEDKLRVLLSLADSSRTVALKAELDKLEELGKRMRYASMAPLLDILIKIERHVTDYYQALAEDNDSSSSLKESISKLQGMQSETNGHERAHLSRQPSMDLPPTSPRRPLEDDPMTDIDTDPGNSNHRDSNRDSNRENSDSHQEARHRRTIPVNSDHGPQGSKENDNPEHSTPLESPGRADLSSTNSDSMADDGYDGYPLDIDDLQSDTVGDDEEDQLDSIRDLEAEDEPSEQSQEDEYYEHQVQDEFEAYDSAANVSTGENSHGDPVGVPEESYREIELAGDSYHEEALGGSSNREGFQTANDRSDESEYSGELETEKEHDNEYDRSYRTADLGGSYREEALGGSCGTSGLIEGGSSLKDGFASGSGHSNEHYDGSGIDEGIEEDDLENFDEEVYDGEPEYDDGQAENGRQEREEVGFEGTLALRGDEDGSVELELKAGYDGDDLSSMGRSMPGIYGSESEDDEEQYDDVEIDFEEHDLEDDEDGDDESEPSDSSYSSKGSGDKADKETKPNPKLEQFFDRLQHFFEVRRKVEDRAEMMDPSGKLKGLKVKVHSGGIRKKSGKYKKEYQQHDLRDKVVRNLDDLYGAAEAAKDELNRLLAQIVSEVKGLDATSWSIPPIKQRNKAFVKAQEEYSDRKPGPPESWLFDIVRGSIVCKSYKQISDVNKWIGKNCHIVTSKNRFRDPAFNGYRDLLFHVSIPYRNDLAHICEIQVHHKDMKALDEQFGMPKHYEYFRSAFAGPWRAQEQILDDLSMLNKHGEIGGQCMVKLMKSKDPDQLRLFARLCRDKLDEFDRALELYRRVLIMQDGVKEDDHEDVADTYLGLGMVLGKLGEVDESLLNFQKALAIKESILGTDHLEVAEMYAEIGHMCCNKGDYKEALKKYRDALAVRETNLGREHFLVIDSLQHIGRALRETGEYKSSEEELRRALKIQETVLGDVHPDVAVTRSMIGKTLCQLGDFSHAMEEHRLALSIRETSLGKNHPLTADAHTNIGIVLCQKGDYEVAEWRHRKALRIQEAVKGKDDEDCAASLTELSEVLKRKGDYDGAIKSIKRATKIREQSLGMDHPVSAGSHLDLGHVYLKKRKYDQALQEFRKAKVVRESFLGQRHPDTAIAYSFVGQALSFRGDHDAALSEHRRALAIYEAMLGKNHPKTAAGYQQLADALFAKGDKDESLIEHRKALAVRANILSKDHPDTAVSCARIGKLLSEKGDLVGALVAYRQALAITEGLCGEDHPDAATAHIHVGVVLAAQGDVEEGMDEIQQAIDVRESTFGKDGADTARAHSVMGTLHSLLGEFEEAQEKHKRSLAIFEKKLGKKNSDTRAARQKLTKAVERKAEENVLACL